MFIHFDVIHERDGRTDRQILRDSKESAYAPQRVVKTDSSDRNSSEVKSVTFVC